MYAIFRAQGKQFRAEPDATLRLPSLEAEPGDKVSFDEVLLAEREGDVRVGTPTLEGARVAAEVVRHGKDDKIVVYKMKRRKGYRRKQGHRQGFTEVRVLEIGFPKGKAKRLAKREKPEPEAPVVEPVEAEASVEKPAAAPEPEAPAEAVAEAPEAGELDITGAARELAEEHGIDLASVEGSGKDGRILKTDVQKAIKAQEGE